MDSLSARYPDSSRHILYGVLPFLIVFVAVAHVGGMMRLLPSLQQPFAGIVTTWRKEYKMFVVGTTSPHWTGIHAGLQVNDRLACIDGHRLLLRNYSTTGDLPAISEICPQPAMWFSDTIAERAATGAKSVTFTVLRDGMLTSVANVPIQTFTGLLLIELFLPAVLHSLGFLLLGFVVYRVNPHAQTNLIFALWATISSAFLVAAVYNIVITRRLEDMSLVAMLLPIPWLPLVGDQFLPFKADASNRIPNFRWNHAAESITKGVRCLETALYLRSSPAV